MNNGFSLSVYSARKTNGLARIRMDIGKGTKERQNDIIRYVRKKNYFKATVKKGKIKEK